MQEITRLLRQKELPLTEIAERMNFSSVSYFSRYIRKRLGVCPTEYRDSLLKKSGHWNVAYRQKEGESDF